MEASSLGLQGWSYLIYKFSSGPFWTQITEVWHMAHFWVSYGRCTMPGSPMGRSEGLSRRWAG